MLTPEEANFDNNALIFSGKIVKFLNGKRYPSEYPDKDFRNQFVWVQHPDLPKALLWCDKEGKWYNVMFYPLSEKP